MKKLLALLLALGLSLSIPLSAYAQESTPVNVQYIEIYNEMLDAGVSPEQAMNHIRLNKISEELEKNSQKIDIVNGEAQIIDSDKTTSSISKTEEEFIIDYVNKEKDKKHITHDAKMKALEKLIKKYPDRSEYKIEFEDDSWVKVISTLERVDPIDNDSIKAYGNIPFPNEKLVTIKAIPSDGTYLHTYTLIENNASNYAKNAITVNYTCSGGLTNTHINSAIGAQSSMGLIMITSYSKEITHSNTIVVNGVTTTYAEAYNSVLFSFSGSVGITLMGVFNIGISPGVTWTQFAITRLGQLSQRDYAGYFI